MSGTAAKLLRLATVLWAGSLWALALWVAPTLFRISPDRHLAGLMAGSLFRIQSVLTVVLALICLWRLGAGSARGLYLAAVMLITNELIIRWLMNIAKAKGPILRLGFGGWHGVSMVLYVIACLGAVSAVWKDDFR